MTDATDEFSYLPAQAADAGIPGPLPPVRRVRLELADGRALTGLLWGEGPPRVTLLHGAGLNAHTWDVTILAARLPALALDLPGHGDSDWRADADYRARTLAPDIAAALDAWAPAPQVVVGQSLGGLTAAALAALRPDRVRALVIVDITPGVDPGAGPAQLRKFFAGPTDFESRGELVDRALAFGLGGARAAAERGVFLNTRVRADGRVEWKHHFAHLAAAALAATPGPGAAPALPRAEGWEDLARATAPITLIRGDRGYVTAHDAAEFAERLPSATVETLPSGHNVQEEAPRALADRIRAVAGGCGRAADPPEFP